LQLGALGMDGFEGGVQLSLHVHRDLISHGPVLGGFIVASNLKENVPCDPLEGLFILSVCDFVELWYLIFYE